MLIEIVGTPGVGKSTVSPMLSRALGFQYYVGLGATSLDGRLLSKTEIRRDLMRSSRKNFPLFCAAFGTGTTERFRARGSFAAAICRRHEFATSVRNLAVVLDGGPFHGLCQNASRPGEGFERHLRAVRLISRADFYVHLVADESTVADRRRSRMDARPVASNSAKYEQFAAKAYQAINANVVTVRAELEPLDTANAAAKVVRDAMERDTSTGPPYKR